MGDSEKHPNVYETINPSIRFAELSKAILSECGIEMDTGPDMPNPEKRYEWKDESGSMIVLRSRSSGNDLNPLNEYILEEHPATDELPTRYRVRNNGRLEMIDLQGVKLELDRPETYNASRQALEILTRQIPIRAEGLLNVHIDQAFRKTVGSYVLSDLLVGESVPNVYEYGTELANDEAKAHNLRMLDIIDVVAEESLQIDDENEREKVQSAADAFRATLSGKNMDIAALAKHAALTISTSAGSTWSKAMPESADWWYDNVNSVYRANNPDQPK